MRPPTRSTLFPTRRSSDLERTFAAMAGRLADLLSSRTSEPRQLMIRDGGKTVVIPYRDIVWIEAEDYCARIHLDRKSTRPNSSHLGISYAVFCLKKKK